VLSKYRGANRFLREMLLSVRSELGNQFFQKSELLNGQHVTSATKVRCQMYILFLQTVMQEF
jgi:hypothetical protein